MTAKDTNIIFHHKKEVQSSPQVRKVQSLIFHHSSVAEVQILIATKVWGFTSYLSPASHSSKAS